MEPWMLVTIGAVVVAVVVAITTLRARTAHRRSAKQTTRLREGFGPEYARAVEEQGRAGGEDALLKRQESAGLFQVRPLSAIEVTRYTENWTAKQAQFVDDPGAALTAAGHLLKEVIAARGYPAAEFEKGASALSVDHPRAVQDYRAAHGVMLRNQRNPVPTDELRAAMVQYHAVFSELMDRSTSAPSAHAA
jgi:hypothetical protein